MDDWMIKPVELVDIDAKLRTWLPRDERGAKDDGDGFFIDLQVLGTTVAPDENTVIDLSIIRGNWFRNVRVDGAIK